MAQFVYVFTSNNGDGSASVCYTRDVELLAKLEDEDPESYGGNEGVSSVLEFPDSLDLEECGFDFMSDDLDGEE